MCRPQGAAVSLVLRASGGRRVRPPRGGGAVGEWLAVGCEPREPPSNRVTAERRDHGPAKEGCDYPLIPGHPIDATGTSGCGVGNDQYQSGFVLSPTSTRGVGPRPTDSEARRSQGPRRGRSRRGKRGCPRRLKPSPAEACLPGPAWPEAKAIQIERVLCAGESSSAVPRVTEVPRSGCSGLR